MTQQPAASVPCGFTASGLPVGMQIIGPRHADALVLRAVRAYERATEWASVRPALTSRRQPAASAHRAVRWLAISA